MIRTLWLVLALAIPSCTYYFDDDDDEPPCPCGVDAACTVDTVEPLVDAGFIDARLDAVTVDARLDAGFIDAVVVDGSDIDAPYP
jgi:hypothetical protein